MIHFKKCSINDVINRDQQMEDRAHRMMTSQQAPSGARIENNQIKSDPLTEAGSLHGTSSNKSSEKPTNLACVQRRKILPNKDLLRDCDIDEALLMGSSSIESDDVLDDFVDSSERTPDSLATSDYLNNSVFDGELDWNESSNRTTPVEPLADTASRLEDEENQTWRTVQLGDKQHRIDLKVIEPYKRLLSHGGYYGDGFNTIIVLTACYLPDKRRRDYQYVMRNLFLYVISTLELLVTDEYTIIYFHGAAPRHKMPNFRWLKQCYEVIDRRFKKNLKRLLIVHPTFFLRTIMLMTKPFISTKFYAKLKYVRGLDELTQLVPMDHVHVPQEIQEYDTDRSKKLPSTTPT